MLIGVEKRFVFIANSKTASTSIERALIPEAEIHRGGPDRGKHILLRQAVRQYDFLFAQKKYAPETFFKFGVMRDPVDWIQSWYRYRVGNKVSNPLPEGTTFEEFWRKRVNRSIKRNQKPQQRDFFTRLNGDLLADYIIPYHELADHFNLLASELDFATKLPKTNVSKVKNLENAPSDALVEEIRDYYSEDYELFNRLEEINKAGLEHLKRTRVAKVKQPAKAEPEEALEE
ncbi:hypothetical protein NBRC116590_31520 [Pelagimonas sp. KU-00592-HH]|uniref:sulfotransferase family 2 domain-containing protein n=1 Tax=Roseobacteraceae TaxID=2854170 RepID=UPI0020CE6282|nr:sulfotransferase family 2 domain-containing protein [Shimia sp. CNT1-13L.2]MCP9483590.1 sulfotransferase family protein [Shimia sp. CNT1-13L.2]